MIGAFFCCFFRQVLCVTDSGSASAFFSSDLTQQLMTEGNAVADRLQAHYTTSTSMPHHMGETNMYWIFNNRFSNNRFESILFTKINMFLFSVNVKVVVKTPPPPPCPTIWVREEKKKLKKIMSFQKKI